MKRFISWTLLLATMLFAACGGGEQPDDNPQNPTDGLSVTISGIVEDYTAISVKIRTTEATSYAYIADKSSLANSYTAQELFANGTTGNCSKSGTTTFTVRNLDDATPYTLYVAVKSELGELSEVVSEQATTKSLPEFAVVSKSENGFKASVRLPESVLPSSVVKWAVTDLATYNYNGGVSYENQLLNRNEAIYANYFTDRYDFDINNTNRTFTKDGVEYSHYDAILPGQPILFLLGEYGEGSHPEYGAGYYSPLFGEQNPSGYFRKEIIITTKPATLTQTPSVSSTLLPSGKGSISIAKPAGAAKMFYLVLNEQQYTEVLGLLDNNANLLQWFTCSPLAAQHFGAVSTTAPTVTIDASQLSLTADATNRLFVCAWEDEGGLKQSFVTSELILPPSAPLKADNIIIAHRGGSAEAGKSSTPDNSIASLKYAMGLGCYASEADIYWTKDNQIIVAHADGNCKINGLYPWENTLAQLQAAGKLSNGETLPSLQDYIRTVMVKGSKTKLCLDIKAITKPTYHHPEAVKACQRACEIIAEMEAENFCEFICSGWEDIVKNCAKYANAAGIDIGAMGNFSASKYKGWGYTWHNRDKGYEIPADKINSYINAGMEVSVFTIDTDADWALIDSYYTKLRGITTNYPKRLLAKFRK